MESLNEKLEKVYEKANLPSDACEMVINWMHNLPYDKVAKEGTQLPDLTLVNHEGKPCNLECLKKHNLVLFFTLGGWCPFCTAEEQALNELYGQGKELGAKMIHISPEHREFLCKNHKDLHLKVESMWDENGKLARSLGLLFEIQDKKLIESFQRIGLDFEKYYGKGNFFYVIPATIIVNKRGKIVRMFAPKDIKKRMEPSEIINCLKQCSDVESS